MTEQVENQDVIEIEEVAKATENKPTENQGKKRRRKLPKTINTGTVSGIIESIEFKKSGSAEIHLNSNPSRSDTPIKGALTPSYFTSTLFFRVPKPVVERIGKENLEAGKNAIVTYRLAGTRNTVETRTFFFLEARIADILMQD